MAYTSPSWRFRLRAPVQDETAREVAPICTSQPASTTELQVDPASARLGRRGPSRPEDLRAVCRLVSWTSPRPMPLPRAAAAVPGSGRRSGCPRASPSSAAARRGEVPGRRAGRGPHGRQQPRRPGRATPHVEVPAVARHVVEQAGRWSRARRGSRGGGRAAASPWAPAPSARPGPSQVRARPPNEIGPVIPGDSGFGQQGHARPAPGGGAASAPGGPDVGPRAGPAGATSPSAEGSTRPCICPEKAQSMTARERPALRGGAASQAQARTRSPSPPHQSPGCASRVAGLAESRRSRRTLAPGPCPRSVTELPWPSWCQGQEPQGAGTAFIHASHSMMICGRYGHDEEYPGRWRSSRPGSGE